MCSKMFLFGLLLALTVPAVSAKTALDLMVEGRFREAKAILDTSNVSPRYQLLYFAMIESDAVRACSLYQVIALRYPNSDCDSVARVRLDQAQEAEFVIVPIAEWAQAAPGARPLALQREQARPVVVEPPLAVVPLPSEELPPSAAEPEALEDEPQVSVRDTIITAEKQPERVEPVVETVAPQPPAMSEIVAVPIEASPEPAVKETEVAPAVEAPDAKLPPEASAIEKAAPLPAAVEVEKVSTEPATKPMAIEAPSAAAISSDLPASNGSWYIQVGAFANFDNAHRLALSLKKAGFPVKLVPRESPKGKLLQVRVGGYSARADLPPIAEQLKESFRVPTVFVSE